MPQLSTGTNAYLIIGPLLPSIPSDQLAIMLKTSGNALTLD